MISRWKRSRNTVPHFSKALTCCILFSSAVFFLGCQSKSSSKKKEVNSTVRTAQPNKSRPAPPTKRNVVLFLGDSLTAGYRLAPSEAYPSLIGQVWKEKKMGWRTRNAGVSGDTTAGVIRRLGWVLTPDIHTVFLAIGANDGMRGQSLKHIEKNLETIITNIQKKKVRVILAGIKLPRNYGKKYYLAFESIYPKLARKHKLAIMPFLLKDVAGIKKLNLPDGIHPNNEGHRIIRNNVLAYFSKTKLFTVPSP